MTCLIQFLNLFRPGNGLMLNRCLIVLTMLCGIALLPRLTTIGAQPKHPLWNAQSRSESGSSATRVDFWNEVRPILAEHCFACHGPEAAEGDLRLDRREYLLKGGHTGVPVFGDSVEQSGLVDRITTSDEFLRMPKSAPPLSDSDIAVLTQWIRQGADYGTPVLDRTDEPDAALIQSVRWLNESIVQHVRPAIAMLLAYLCYVIWVERTRKRLRTDSTAERGNRVDSPNKRTGWIKHLTVMTIIGLAGCSFYFHGTRAVAVSQREDALEQLVALQEQIRPKPRGPGEVPFIYNTGHPKRIGGTYYRGNDERSPRLFNGGYYRTATLDLGLRDQSMQVVQANTDCRDRELSIYLRIARAPLGIRALYSDSIMNSIYLSRQLPGIVERDQNSEPAYLDVVEPGEVWEGTYLIPVDETPSGNRHYTGMVYVYKGAEKDGTRGPNDIAHYAIEYDLAFEDGKLSTESSLRMGSVYHSGNIVFTPDGKIPVSRWFDFQPIPEKEPVPSR